LAEGAGLLSLAQSCQWPAAGPEPMVIIYQRSGTRIQSSTKVIVGSSPVADLRWIACLAGFYNLPLTEKPCFMEWTLF